jgi:outer membrane protein insertion porin family
MPLSAQEVIKSATDTTRIADGNGEDADLPVITYTQGNKIKYAIADIKISGVENTDYDIATIIGITGLSVGQKVAVPGNEITTAIKALLKQRRFADITVLATKMTADSVWLEINLKSNPTISNINYHGVKKGEREELEIKIGMIKGTECTPDLLNRANKRIKSYFDNKGFNKAEINVRQMDDLTNEGNVILDIFVDKKDKIKIREINISGNENIKTFDLKMVMKKTNEGFSLKKYPKLSLRKMFSTKKFIQEEYENDLENIIQKYNEKGYRDAKLINDTVFSVDEKHVSIPVRYVCIALPSYAVAVIFIIRFPGMF